MTSIALARPPRAHKSDGTDEPVVLAAPPTEVGPSTGAGWQAALPALGSLGAITFAAVNPQPVIILAAGLFALAGIGGAVAMAVTNHRARWRQRDQQRLVYLDYLDGVTTAAAQAAGRQRSATLAAHPAPDTLARLVVERTRVWERRGRDADFLHARVGVGDSGLVAPRRRWIEQNPLTVHDPVLVRAADDVLVRTARVPHVPLVLDLRDEPVLTFSGDLDCARALVRAIVCAVAVLHAPGDVRVEVASDQLGAWAWCRWLPHASGGGHVLRIADGVGASPTAEPGVTELRIGQPAGVDVVVDAAGVATLPDGRCFAADALGATAADAISRALAPLVLDGDHDDDEATAASGIAGLLDLGDPSDFDPVARWSARSGALASELTVPFGVDDDGRPVVLDLKEAALGGDGPHGLMVGATGSGKSEALRTIVLGLAVRHPPHVVSFVLVDYKGGAAFADLVDLPHVAGSITNLVDDGALVDRVHDALAGELRRRQELLRAAGNLASIWHLRAQDAGALPHLLVLIDEFSELLVARPELIDLFNAIGRLGRSLGIHLLFATQRLDEGRLRGLESHLSYRLALRTFSAAESRAVIGSDAAFTLPPEPGLGVLATPSGVRRFRTALASAPWEPPPAPTPDVPVVPRLLAAPEPAAPSSPAAPAATSTVLDAVVARIAASGVARTHAVWLPPLPPVLTLDEVLGPLEIDVARGLHTRAVAPGALLVPYGLADRPPEQRQEIALHDFTGAGSNLLVVGAPQAGTSSLLRALVAGLALTHTAAEAQVYAIDLGGGGLAALSDLPHVGAVATRAEPERVGRIIRHAVDVVSTREHLFTRLGIDGIAAYRARRAAGALDEPGGDVFVIVDGWAAFRTEFEELEPVVTELAGRAAGYGVHLVVAAHRAMDLRLTLKDLFGGRIELRLADPGDSDIDRRAAARVTTGAGRALTAGSVAVQVALARVDGRPDAATAAEGGRRLAARSAAAWSGPPAPPILLLPAEVDLDDLETDPSSSAVPIGIADTDLRPVSIDLFGSDPHLLVFGESGSGKTELLRTLATAITRRRSPDEVRFVVADPRRQLLDAIPDDHLAAYGPTGSAIAAIIERLVATLAEREPPADLDAQTLRDRSWWSGPDLVVLVDDHELLETRDGPLTPLAPWLPNAVDLGLHVVLARRSGGAARAAYDPVIQQIRDHGQQGILLSGDPAEGPLLGAVRPSPRPPGRGVLVRRRHDPLTVHVARTRREPVACD